MDPYKVLQLEESATKEQVEESYRRLREQYAEARFQPGEAGAEAAEKLGELERAYQDVLNDLQSKENRQQYGTEYGEIEALIKSGELTEAQQKLDDIPVHDGEWHYLQSIVFYKKNWFLESKKQLEYALKADPENTKYRNSLNKLQQILASNTISPDQLHSKESHTTDGTSRGKGIPTCTGNCCSDLCIADCCCECMGGDLIPCC